jgi:dynein heavy chain
MSCRTPCLAGKGTVYDYLVNPKTGKFQPWAELVMDVQYDSGKPMSSMFVPTAETSSLRFFLDMMVDLHKPIMFVGGECRRQCTIYHQCQFLLCSSSYIPVNAGLLAYGGPLILGGATNACCLCTGAGVGKTQLVKGKLACLPEEMICLGISFNYFTDVVSFQNVSSVHDASQYLTLQAGTPAVAGCCATVSCM